MFSEIENALRLAVSICETPCSKIASAIGYSGGGFKCWRNGANHISVERGDALYHWLYENAYEALEYAFKRYSLVILSESANALTQ